MWFLNQSSTPSQIYFPLQPLLPWHAVGSSSFLPRSHLWPLGSIGVVFTFLHLMACRLILSFVICFRFVLAFLGFVGNCDVLTVFAGRLSNVCFNSERWLSRVFPLKIVHKRRYSPVCMQGLYKLHLP